MALLSRRRLFQVPLLPPEGFDAVLAGVLLDMAAGLGAGSVAALPALDVVEEDWLRRNWDRNPRTLARLVERVLAETAEPAMGRAH